MKFPTGGSSMGAAVAAGVLLLGGWGPSGAQEAARSGLGEQAGSAPLPDTVEATLREGTNMAAALSPDGRELALDLQGTLWTVPVEGGEARALTDHLGDVREPTWAPDGERIAFQSYRGGNWHIWTIRRDGSELRQRTFGTFDDREPHWSPDGSRIAFTSDRGEGSYDVWEVEVETGEIRRLTRDPGNAVAPAWHPDGGGLAFLSDRSGESGLWVRDADGEVVLVAAAQGRLAGAAWSPDGRRLSFQSVAGPEAALHLVEVPEGILAADGGAGPDRDALPLEATRISEEGEDVFPFRAGWASPDAFFYTADGQIKHRSLADGSEEAVPFAATVTLLRYPYRPRDRSFDADGAERTVGIVSPAVSPEGDRVAFAAVGDLWLLSVGDPRPDRLTRDPYLRVDPTWSPDGSRIAYASDRAGSVDLWTLDVASGEETRLTDLPGTEKAPSWSPDGTAIAFLDEGGDVRVVDVESGSIRTVETGVSNPGRPTWSGDGSAVAVAELQRYSGRFREGVNQIRVLPVNGGEPRILAPFPDRSIGPRGNNPVWSPDGSKLAFLRDGMLWVQPVDPGGEATGPPRLVAAELADSPSWTRDGRTLVYLEVDRLRRASLDDGRIEVIPLELTWERSLPEGRTIIHAGRLWDGTSDQLRENVDIIVEGHRIAAVEPHLPEHHTGEVVDASDLTVIPGLWDMHSHQGGGPADDALGRLEGMGRMLGLVQLAYGVTSVREPSANPWAARERREAMEAGTRRSPRVFFTGGSFDGSRVFYSADMALDGPGAQLDLQLDRVRRLDYDLIKTYVRLPDELQRRIVEFAHENAIHVTSHELFPAVAFGSHGVEHVMFTSRRGYSPKATLARKSYQDVVELLTRSGMSYDPTLGIHGAYDAVILRNADEIVNDPRLEALSPPHVLERIRNRAEVAGNEPRRSRVERQLAPVLETVRRVVEGGGLATTGTDAPLSPYGLGVHIEMEGMVLGGVPEHEALRAATVNPARTLGVAEHLGTVEPGKLADLVLVEGNPLNDIRDARRVRAVVQNGVVHELEALIAR